MFRLFSFFDTTIMFWLFCCELSLKDSSLAFPALKKGKVQPIPGWVSVSFQNARYLTFRSQLRNKLFQFVLVSVGSMLQTEVVGYSTFPNLKNKF